MTVSRTILRQLGGNRFIAMTGTKNFTGSDNKLTFALPRGTKRQAGKPVPITHVSIELKGNDTYLVSFLNCRIARSELSQGVVEVFDGAYAEDLERIFTATTGLYTHI